MGEKGTAFHGSFTEEGIAVARQIFPKTEKPGWLTRLTVLEPVQLIYLSIDRTSISKSLNF
jgi:hypothetical protein